MKNTYNIASLSGAALCVIPFYAIIKIVKEFRLFKTSIAAVILTSLTLIFTIPMIIILVELMLAVVYYFMAIPYEMEGISISYDQPNVLLLLLIFTLLSIVVITFNIIVGFIFKNKSEDANNTPQDNFEYAKLAGIFFTSIPFYLPIKTIISMRDIDQMQKPCTGLATALIVLFFVNTFFPFFISITSTAYCIVTIVLGVRLSDEKMYLDQTPIYDYENFDSF